MSHVSGRFDSMALGQTYCSRQKNHMSSLPSPRKQEAQGHISHQLPHRKQRSSQVERLPKHRRCDNDTLAYLTKRNQAESVSGTYSNPRPKTTDTPSLFRHVIFRVQMTRCGSKKMAISETSWILADDTWSG